MLECKIGAHSHYVDATFDQMKLVMSEGQDELEKKMQEDPETYECVTKLNQIMGKLGQS